MRRRTSTESGTGLSNALAQARLQGATTKSTASPLVMAVFRLRNQHPEPRQPEPEPRPHHRHRRKQSSLWLSLASGFEARARPGSYLYKGGGTRHLGKEPSKQWSRWKCPMLFARGEIRPGGCGAMLLAWNPESPLQVYSVRRYCRAAQPLLFIGHQLPSLAFAVAEQTPCRTRQIAARNTRARTLFLRKLHRSSSPSISAFP